MKYNTENNPEVVNWIPVRPLVLMCFYKRSVCSAVGQENSHNPAMSSSLLLLWSLFGNPQTQEHPGLNLDENTQSQVSFQTLCLLVAGPCLFKGFGGTEFLFAGYFEGTCQRRILDATRLVRPDVARDGENGTLSDTAAWVRYISWCHYVL